MDTYLFLKWAHILAMAYWLGGEWGVFNASRPVTDINLSLEERRRHMETAYLIDILPRTAIILLLPLGLHMGSIMTYHPLGSEWVIPMWVFVAFWLSITFTAFRFRGTDKGLFYTRVDESFRYVVIPMLVGFGIYSLFTGWPFTASWYAAKALIYGLLLIIGLLLRFIMKEWVILFRILDNEGSNVEVENKLSKSLAFGRFLAYFYWIGIATVAWFGVFKPIF
ncbi:MAG: hypothetical protein CMP02_02280 [Woeseiaceae bacterium]|jgi:hypothetical protein|nr:hypothetical protein [Woeseiaceae bacterium]|tara:strand:- start:124 stop:792 length:669 start_codon:yes stop_codon:yes gene_type:complete